MSTCTKLNIPVTTREELNEAFEWCKKHCQDHWHISFPLEKHPYTLFFDSERDYVAFKLWNSK